MKFSSLPIDLPSYSDMKVGDIFIKIGFNDSKEEHAHFCKILYKNPRIAEVEYKIVGCNMHGKFGCQIGENLIATWQWFEYHSIHVRWIKNKTAAILFADRGSNIT